MTSLLVAKLSLVALAGTYLPLFLGVRRGRRAFAALSVAAAAALLTFSALALQTRADLARTLGLSERQVSRDIGVLKRAGCRVARRHATGYCLLSCPICGELPRG